MKKLFYLLLIVLGIVSFSACDDDTSDPITPAVSDTTNTNTTTVVTTDTTTIVTDTTSIVTDTTNLEIVKTYKTIFKLNPTNKIDLTGAIINISGDTTLALQTDKDGETSAYLFAGKYLGTISQKLTINGSTYNIDGNLEEFEITETYDTTKINEIAIDVVELGEPKIIIKELYFGGCDNFLLDKYVILYNNSNNTASIQNLCIGMACPYNSNATNANELFYEKENWIPAQQGIWYFTNEIQIEPYSEIVISITGAINHTTQYPNSVNLENADYVMYDKESQYTLESYYPKPTQVPSTNWFKAIFYGTTGTAWPISTNSPAFFIFKSEYEPTTLVDNLGTFNHSNSEANKSLKVPMDWVIDGVEVYNGTTSANLTASNKRIPLAIDEGKIIFTTNKKGYTIYRNVDKAATEALPENEGKLVYNYDKGTADVTNGSTDSSGIDAEASIKNGAHIIYQDTNNSTNDFHQRKQASLKD